MEQAISFAWSKGKGIYAMKALGGGHLISDLQRAFDYIINFPYLHSIAVGMQRIEEVEINVDIFNGKVPNKEKLDSVKNYERNLFIQDWCTGCGRCIRRCQQGALSIGKDKITSRCKNAYFVAIVVQSVRNWLLRLFRGTPFQV